MSMRMDAGMDMSAEMRAWVSPSLIEANYILSLSRQERQETSYEDHPEILTQQTANGIAEDDFDPLTLIASEASLPEQILSDVRTLLNDEEVPIAEWLVESLDDRGYLTVS